MSFFENLDESGEGDFLSRVRKTQEAIGNVQQGEKLATGVGSTVGTLGGGLDDDGEDDFFKEFALEDLDAPTTQHSDSLNQKPKGSQSYLPSFNSEWEVPDLTEVSLEAQRGENGLETGEQAVAPPVLEEQANMTGQALNTSIPSNPPTQEAMHDTRGDTGENGNASENVDLAKAIAIEGTELNAEITEEADQPMATQAPPARARPNDPELKTRDKERHQTEQQRVAEEVPEEKNAAVEQVPSVPHPTVHPAEWPTTQARLPEFPEVTQPRTNQHAAISRPQRRESHKSKDRRPQLSHLRSKTPPVATPVQLCSAGEPRREQRRRISKPLSQPRTPLTLFQKRRPSRSPTPKHTTATQSFTRPHGERKAPRLDINRTPIAEPMPSCQISRRAFVPVRPTPPTPQATSEQKTLRIDTTATLHSLLAAQRAREQVQDPTRETPPTPETPVTQQNIDVPENPAQESDPTVPTADVSAIAEIPHETSTEPEPEDFSAVTRQLERVALEARLMREHIIETRVRLAIQSNKLLRLDNPIVAERLSKLANHARRLLGESSL